MEPYRQRTNHFHILWHAFNKTRNPRPRGPVLGVLTVSNILSPHLWAPHSYHIANALTFRTSPSKDTTECKFLTRFLWERESSAPRACTWGAHGVKVSISPLVGIPFISHCKCTNFQNLPIYGYYWMQILDTLSLREGILGPEGVYLGCSQCQSFYLPTCRHPIHITLQMH
jgi:hypothetical protein